VLGLRLSLISLELEGISKTMQPLYFYIYVSIRSNILYLTDGFEDATNPVPNTQTAAANATFAAEVQAEYYQNKTGKFNFTKQ
jgi:hypothetical protein